SPEERQALRNPALTRKVLFRYPSGTSHVLYTRPDVRVVPLSIERRLDFPAIYRLIELDRTCHNKAVTITAARLEEAVQGAKGAPPAAARPARAREEEPVDEGPAPVKREGRLTAEGPRDTALSNSVRWVHRVRLRGGRTYRVELASAEFDAYLR